MSVWCCDIADKGPPAMLTSHTDAALSTSCCIYQPVLDNLPGIRNGKAAEDSPSALAPEPTWETQRKLLPSGWPSLPSALLAICREKILFSISFPFPSVILPLWYRNKSF